MTSLTRLTLALLAALALFAPAAIAQEGGATPPPTTGPPPPPSTTPPTPRLVVNTPRSRTLIKEGQGGRLLMGGRWYFRIDDNRAGIRRRFFRQRSLRGWARVSVPHSWNARDYVFNRSSVGWYRTEFRLPRRLADRGVRWKLRFEGVNHSAVVYMNGRQIGKHTGGYTPFEVDARLKRGRNRLVVRASTLRGPKDLTHWRVARFNGYGTGGWWNFGGIQREVYVRRVDRVDIEELSATPSLRAPGSPARVRLRAVVRNLARRTGRVRIAFKLGRRTVKTISPRVRGRGRRQVITSFTIGRPQLWQPGRPTLYSLTATAGGPRGGRARYRLAFGVRKVIVGPGGRIFLNGRRLNLRGASIHEDDPGRGSAWNSRLRDLTLNYLRALGANVTRAHYPLHPAFMEKLDRAGILFWAQAPVYQVRPESIAQPNVRRNALVAVREMVRHNANHPSIIVWSVDNELSGNSGGSYFNETLPAYTQYIDAARATIRARDNTRLIGIDRQSLVAQPDPAPAIRRLDVIGLNEYFGWYRASNNGVPSSTSSLRPFLDRIHALYPGQAIVVTEFGAESNRLGAESDKGTIEFQRKWMRDHLTVQQNTPYLSGSIVWALRDFRVHPSWAGGNPRPGPPWNNKGLIDENGFSKPAFYDIQRRFRSTRPLG